MSNGFPKSWRTWIKNLITCIWFQCLWLLPVLHVLFALKTRKEKRRKSNKFLTTFLFRIEMIFLLRQRVTSEASAYRTGITKDTQQLMPDYTEGENYILACVDGKSVLKYCWKDFETQKSERKWPGRPLLSHFHPLKFEPKERNMLH